MNTVLRAAERRLHRPRRGFIPRADQKREDPREDRRPDDPRGHKGDILERWKFSVIIVFRCDDLIDYEAIESFAREVEGKDVPSIEQVRRMLSTSAARWLRRLSK